MSAPTVTDMSETSARYNTIADAFGARLEGMATTGWSAPTPCSEWTVRDLLAHVIGVHGRVIATLDASEPLEPDLAGDLLPVVASEPPHQRGPQ
jgi:uncharacterized protein (TIGR03083 family)